MKCIVCQTFSSILWIASSLCWVVAVQELPDIIAVVYYHFNCPFSWGLIQGMFTHAKVLECSLNTFSSSNLIVSGHKLISLIHSSWFLCMRNEVGGLVSVFHIRRSYFANITYWKRLSLPHGVVVAQLSWISWWYECGLICGVSVLFCWSTCQSQAELTLASL